MFFQISKQFDPRFHHHRQVGKFRISLDRGWQILEINNKTVLFKGYCESMSMQEVAMQMCKDALPKFRGNFCVLVIDDRHVTVTHDVDRAFPIYINEDGVTNLHATKLREQCWASCQLTVDDELDYVLTQVQPTPCVPTPNLDTQGATDILFDIFASKTQGLLAHNQGPIRSYLSGGLDTLTAFAFLYNQAPQRLEIIDYEHFEYDTFVVQVREELNKFWSYSRIALHHWIDPCIFATGGCGDEFSFRGPSTVATWAAWHDINLLQLMQDRKTSYHYYYYTVKNRDIFEKIWSDRKNLQSRYRDYQDLSWHLLDVLRNDHQHWHLGNTLTWTPFKDIRIIETLLCMRPDDLVAHTIDNTVCCAMISKIDPGLCQGLSAWKAYNSRENVHKLYRHLANSKPELLANVSQF